MAQKKSVPIVDGHYVGNLSEYTQQAILHTTSQQCIPKLKHMICTFPYDLIDKADEKDMSVLEYCRENNIDIKQYWGELRDYQTVGTGFLYLSPFSMLGDGVGIGKTVEVAALLNMLRMTKEMSRVLIAVETGAVQQFVREMKRFTGMRVIELPSQAAPMKKVIDRTDWSKVDIIVTKHTALKNNTFLTWLGANVYYDEQGRKRNNLYDVVILDESSVIKSDSTQQYTYTKAVMEMASRAHLLNATAFETCIFDIYYQMAMIIPEALPPKSHISKEYCVYQRNYFWKTVGGKPQQFQKFDLAGYKNQEAFKEKLKLFYFARSIKEVGMTSDNMYLVSEITPTQEQMKLIKKGYRANEVLNDPSLIPDIELKTTPDDVPKLQRLISLCLSDFRNSKILIYCFHVNAQMTIANILRAAGKNVEIINGNTKDKDKVKIQESFNHGDTDILITNAKRSLNLYGGEVCIMYSLEAVPAKMEQIRGRMDRHVDDKKRYFVLMYYLFTFEYSLFFGTASSRNKASKELTVDYQSAVDLFLQAAENGDKV